MAQRRLHAVDDANRFHAPIGHDQRFGNTQALTDVVQVRQDPGAKVNFGHVIDQCHAASFPLKLGPDEKERV
ncbi:hypothetical protein D3C87_2013560 [compost metagenome]